MLDELELTKDAFLDKMTVIFGATNTGKSVVTVDILHKLAMSADQIVVISPTNAQNRTYTGVVPAPLIWPKLTGELLDNLWERQEAMKAIYNRANNLDVLKTMFDRCAPRDRRIIEQHVTTERNTALERARRDSSSAEAEEIEKTYKEFLQTLFKDTIINNKHSLGALTAKEQFVLQYIDFNPRIVLVLDDCTAQLKALHKHKVIQELFYQGRHAGFTTIIAAHTEKSLDPEYRKNAFITMWTEPSSANSYMMKEFKDDKVMRTQMMQAIESTFVPHAKYQKLAFIRAERAFKRFTAVKRIGFRFCSPLIWSFMDKITRSEDDISDRNKFISEFST